MATADLIAETIAQHITQPKVISYAPSKLNEVTGRFVASNRVYNFILNKEGVSYSPAGQGDSLLFSALFLRQDAARKPKVGNDKCNAGKSYQCGKICLGNRRKCHKGVRDVNDTRRIASILESTNEKLKGNLEGSDKAISRGKALFEARGKREKNGKEALINQKDLVKMSITDLFETRSLAKRNTPIGKKNISTVSDEIERRVPSKEKAKTSRKTPKEVLQLEDKLRTQKFESLGAFTKDGKRIAFLDGGKYEVYIPNELGVKFKDAIITHNHPMGLEYPPNDPRSKGNSFSGEDVDVMFAFGAAEIRAVSQGYRHSLKPPKGGWKFKSRDELKKAWNKIKADVESDFWSKINAGEMSHIDAEANDAHEKTTRFADKYKAKYVRTPHKD
jgi:hypothetical protein